MGRKRTLLGVDQAFRGLSKLGETPLESGRNAPLADRCFELLDQGDQLIRQSLDLTNATVSISAVP